MTEQVTQLGGIIFLAYTIMAAAYWIDSARWYDKAERLPPGPERDKYLSIAKRAENMFRFSTAMMILAILLTVLPLYVPSDLLTTICKWALLVPLAGILVMSVLYTAARYRVPLRSESEDSAEVKRMARQSG